MDIIVKGSPKEIAAFVLELQGSVDAMMDIITRSFETINNVADETKEKSPNTANEQAFLVAAEQVKNII